MNYWAKDDPLFADGHYVEDWELRRFAQFTTDLQEFVLSEAALGNKLQSIAFPTIFLSGPPVGGVLNLPGGLCFVCPLQHAGTRLYDGDEEGVILHLNSGARVYPSGYESEAKQTRLSAPIPSHGA